MQLQFFGAARTVTGSMFLLTLGGCNILIECGLRQGSPKEEQENFAEFPFDVAKLHAVVLTHAHLDHSGRIPLLVKRGYNGPIHTHSATGELCEILFQDAAHINEKETIWENKKRARKGLSLLSPLYSQDEAKQAVSQFQTYGYGESVTIAPGVAITFHDAGHILGSAIVELLLTEGGMERRIVFSGDLGHSGAPILRDPAVVTNADLVVMESTYGDRLHRSWEQTWLEMQDIFRSPSIHKGNILIPSFAIGRSQEVMYGLAKHYQDWNIGQWSIFLDSPLAIKATEIYRNHVNLYDRETLNLTNNNTLENSSEKLFGLANVHYSLTAEQSMALNQINNGAIIIAGSGMCDGGRIKHHLKHNVWRRDCNILIVGYQAQGTLGRRLVDGAKHIRLWGETIQVNAKIHTIGGFSAHADQRGLLHWLGQFKSRPHVVLVHGENRAIDTLREEIAGNFTFKVLTPEKNQRLELTDFELY